MKKITMLLAAIGLATSSMAFSQEELIKVGEPYIITVTGERVSGTMDELCWASFHSREMNSLNPASHVLEAKFHSFSNSRDGAKATRFNCVLRSEVARAGEGSTVIWVPSNNGEPYIAKAADTAICHIGGFYTPFMHGCFEYQEVK